MNIVEIADMSGKPGAVLVSPPIDPPAADYAGLFTGEIHVQSDGADSAGTIYQRMQRNDGTYCYCVLSSTLHSIGDTITFTEIPRSQIVFVPAAGRRSHLTIYGHSNGKAQRDSNGNYPKTKSAPYWWDLELAAFQADQQFYPAAEVATPGDPALAACSGATGGLVLAAAQTATCSAETLANGIAVGKSNPLPAEQCNPADSYLVLNAATGV